MKKLVFILLCIFTLFACKKQEANGKGYVNNVIRINDTGQMASCVQRIIKLQNMLELYLPENVNVEWTNILNTDAIRDSVATNQIDIAGMGIVAFIAAKENGYPLILLSATAGANAYLYSNNININKFKDISSSSRIAIQTIGSSYYLAFLIATRDVFGDPLIFNKNLITMPPVETLSSLKTSKDLDCAVIQLPYSIEANKIENLTMIEDLNPIMIKYGLTACFFTNEKFFNKNPILIDAFNKAVVDAVKFINEYTSEAAFLLSDSYGIEPIYIEEQFRSFPVELEIKGYDNISNLLFEIGLLDRKPGKFGDLPNYKDIPKIE